MNEHIKNRIIWLARDQIPFGDSRGLGYWYCVGNSAGQTEFTLFSAWLSKSEFLFIVSIQALEK
jgi:hypothetical protein